MEHPLISSLAQDVELLTTAPQQPQNRPKTTGWDWSALENSEWLGILLHLTRI